jgi:hypothetical protein
MVFKFCFLFFFCWSKGYLKLGCYFVMLFPSFGYEMLVYHQIDKKRDFTNEVTLAFYNISSI